MEEVAGRAHSPAAQWQRLDQVVARQTLAEHDVDLCLGKMANRIAQVAATAKACFADATRRIDGLELGPRASVRPEQE